jgi:hypothetical protein
VVRTGGLVGGVMVLGAPLVPLVVGVDGVSATPVVVEGVDPVLWCPGKALAT